MTSVAAVPVVMAALTAGITGCGSGALQSGPSSAAIEGLEGPVMGGSQPVAYANVQHYAPGTTGYGAAATPLFSRAITTDAKWRVHLFGGV